jgi:DNA-binding MarR family transcriptional regulator
LRSQVLSAQDAQALHAWARLLRAHAAMTRSFNAELQAAHGLTVSDIEVLKVLSDAPDGRLRRVDLAERVRLTPSGITRLLDGLQAAGLVCKERCSADARVTYARLTDEGLATFREAEAGYLAALARLFGARYAADELEALVELLGRLPGAGAGLEEMCSGEDSAAEESG